MKGLMMHSIFFIFFVLLWLRIETKKGALLHIDKKIDGNKAPLPLPSCSATPLLPQEEICIVRIGARLSHVVAVAEVKHAQA
jgi:hypothetical protein